MSSIRISPSCVSRRPAMLFNSVVFPQPEAPRSEINSPVLISRFIFFSILIFCKCYRIVTFVTVILYQSNFTLSSFTHLFRITQFYTVLYMHCFFVIFVTNCYITVFPFFILLFNIQFFRELLECKARSNLISKGSKYLLNPTSFLLTL